jgi:hypothetical protein
MDDATKGSNMRDERGTVGVGWLAAIAAVTLGGVGLGVAFGDRGGGGVTVDAALAGDGQVDLFRCPGAEAIGLARSGDRLQATARTAAGEWVEVRAPSNLSERVWIARDVIDPDRELEDLPVHDCAERVDYASGSTAPTTIPVGSTTVANTTTVPGVTTEVPTTDPPENTSAPTPTSAGDSSAPQISAITKDTEHIYEDVPGVCPGHPTSVLVRATVSDDRGVSAVTLEWSVGPLSGEIAMNRQGSQWSATIGPLAAAAVAYPEDRAPLNFTIRARDVAGNTREADNGLEVFDCTFI